MSSNQPTNPYREEFDKPHSTSSEARRNVLILMPTSGMITTETTKTLIGATQLLPKRGLGVAFKTFEWSDLVISRNYLVSYFLADRKFTHALLLDSDLSFEPALILELLQRNEDFMVAPYPQRQIKLNKLCAEMKTSLSIGDEASMNAVLSRSYHYLVHSQWEDGLPYENEKKPGQTMVAGAGTGLMLISRKVPEEMVRTGQAKCYGRQATFGDVPAGAFFDFFSHLPDKASSYLYAEDQSFCRRWVRGCQGKIWALNGARVTHHGTFPFHGHYNPD